MNHVANHVAIENDWLRTTFSQNRFCKIYLSQIVSTHPKIDKIILTVKSFDSFTEDNDPFGEHNFGKFKLEGESFIWKIDYADPEGFFDQTKKHKQLTVMHSSEY